MTVSHYHQHREEQARHDATQWIAHFRRQKTLATDPPTRAAAGARILAWTQTRDALDRQITAKAQAATA
jgi:hypothetical protein